jgi:hypothetical protein
LTCRPLDDTLLHRLAFSIVGAGHPNLLVGREIQAIPARRTPEAIDQ